ncbi:helix-turn-helix transcriptional regulator [Paenibacillus odorifer]|jgi:transcriptional regulator with XRE-family HTH domain|uniref:helix-turn-helix domain-containing protein n=1 Tax=Paenibacillus TaxID=44249 RepID=UPI00096DA5C4|nr:helix-turn-helix transcriptional regulator [Paenibacillus odorifer]OMC97108.1 transcriptional regulator [Paenibacillus odorifer]OME03402.1 transcriptional regulator [Paenibacillus odorifer]
MYEKFEDLLNQHGTTAYRVAKDTGITTSTLTSWKQGKYTPKREKLQKIADYFGVTVNYLMGVSEESKETQEDKPYYALSEKDERDIAKELEKMMNDLNSNASFAFMGEPMDDEDRELLRISLENTLRMSKEMAKKKFTPKKFRE